MEPFIFELGTRANKVEILCKEDNSIEVKPKGHVGFHQENIVVGSRLKQLIDMIKVVIKVYSY